MISKKTITSLSLLSFLSLSNLSATDSTWTGSVNSEWLNGGNWDTNPLVPNATDDTATFTTAGAGTVLIDSSGGAKVSQVTFNSGSYTIAPGSPANSPLIFSGTGSSQSKRGRACVTALQTHSTRNL